MYMCSSGWILTGSDVRATGYVVRGDIARSPLTEKERNMCPKHAPLFSPYAYLFMLLCTVRQAISENSRTLASARSSPTSARVAAEPLVGARCIFLQLQQSFAL